MSAATVTSRARRSIRDLVPGCVELAQSDRDLGFGATPGELASLGRASPARRAEFVTGRALARQALAAVGAPAQDVPRTAGGAPAWPTGFVGSITHCSGFRAAAAALRRDVRGLGIDAEVHRPLRAGIERLVGSGAERREWPQRPGLWPGVVAFSAKESVYKALVASGATGLLDFLDLELAFTRLEENGDGVWHGEFEARLCGRRRPAGRRVTVGGRWLVVPPLVFTAVVLSDATEVRRCV